MKPRTTLVGAAVLLAFAQWPLTAAAQAQKTPAAPAAAASAAAAQAPLTAKAPSDWIEYQDTTFTPVVDAVSRHLADARAALAKKDQAGAAESMRAAASALQAQADRVATLDRHRAAADIKLARETHARMVALVKKLDATAAQVQAGKVATIAQLDKTLDKAARADLERRWLVTDATTWYPVAGEPQRHFTAAAQAYAKKDYKTAATEVRKGEAYLRLESARAVGDVKTGLDAADAELERTAKALDKGALKSDKGMDKAFADANHELALAHRAKAAQSWADKAYDQAGYELKASGQDLENGAAWAGTQAKAAAAGAAADTRALGDKLASGGVWAKDEVVKGFDTLGNALDKLGETVGSKTRAAHFGSGT